MSSFNDNFSPNDFFQISSDIQDAVSQQTTISLNSKDAAWLRIAISRAYYSAFLALKEEFLKDGNLQSKIKNNGGDHGVVKDELVDNLPYQLQYLANFLEDLRDERNFADYDLPPEYEVNPSKVQTSFGMAQDILNNVQNIMRNL